MLSRSEMLTSGDTHRQRGEHEDGAFRVANPHC
jgi:hypothetical protein